MPIGIEEIKREITASLLPLDPEMVVLFGSYAYGQPDQDSDVDLYIVSREKFIPQSYRSNMDHYQKYTRPLRPLKEQVPMDIIVHTLEMNRIFEEGDSSLVREIKARGVRLI
jgi:uncharacterized protein